MVSTFPWGHTRTEKIKEIAAKKFQDVNSWVSVEDNASCVEYACWPEFEQCSCSSRGPWAASRWLVNARSMWYWYKSAVVTCFGQSREILLLVLSKSFPPPFVDSEIWMVIDVIVSSKFTVFFPLSYVHVLKVQEAMEIIFISGIKSRSIKNSSTQTYRRNCAPFATIFVIAHSACSLMGIPSGPRSS